MKRLFVISSLCLAFLASCGYEGNDNSAAASKYLAYIDASSEILFSADDLEKEISVYSDNIPWTIDEIPSWLIVEPSEGTGSTTVSLVASPHGESEEDRTATLLAKFDFESRFVIKTEINISQSGKPLFNVPTTQFQIGSEGGIITIPVSTSSDYEVEVFNAWLTISEKRDNEVLIEIEENTGYDSRTAEVLISSGERQAVVSIIQGQYNEMIIEATIYRIDRNGGEITVPISSNNDYTCEILGEAKKWISVKSVDTDTKALEDKLLVLKIDNYQDVIGRIGQVKIYGEGKDFLISIEQSGSYESLTSDGFANSYLVIESGSYFFPCVKGNSSNLIGDIASAEVLWESFGTSASPNKGDLIKSVSYSDGMIGFVTSSPFVEGNAVVVAKDSKGTILWSWHIWLSQEEFTEVKYADKWYRPRYLMDRNLGALSAESGDVGALGLLYQWGRKDPFLGSSSISTAIRAASTIVWPQIVDVSSITDVETYAAAHPTTLISEGGIGQVGGEWDLEKTIYDPCPPGWKVPSHQIWVNAGIPSEFHSTGTGIWIGSPYCAPLTWYPATGSIDATTGEYLDAGYFSLYISDYWACDRAKDGDAYYFSFYCNSDGDTYVSPNGSTSYPDACAVRCQKEVSE